MLFLTYIASLSLATFCLQIALASPIESSTKSAEVEQTELNAIITNTNVYEVEDASNVQQFAPVNEVEDETNIIQPAPVYDVEAASNVTQTRNDLEVTRRLDMRLDYIIEIALKTRHSFKDVYFLTLQFENRKLISIIFATLSSMLYCALGASGAALGAYIIHPNDSDLILRAAIKGFNCSLFDNAIQAFSYHLQLLRYGGEFLYYGGLLFGPVLSTWLTTYFAANGNGDKETERMSVMAGVAIGFVSLACNLIPNEIIYPLSRMMSKCGINVKKTCRNESSVVWTMITSAIAGILATILMDKNWVAGLFVALFSLNPSLIGLLPLIENKTLS